MQVAHLGLHRIELLKRRAFREWTDIYKLWTWRFHVFGQRWGNDCCASCFVLSDAAGVSTSQPHCGGTGEINLLMEQRWHHECWNAQDCEELHSPTVRWHCDGVSSTYTDEIAWLIVGKAWEDRYYCFWGQLELTENFLRFFGFVQILDMDVFSYLIAQLFYSLFSDCKHMFKFEICLLSPNGRTGWGRLHLPTGDVGSFSSWGSVILGCIDIWLVPLQYSSWTSWSLKFRNRTFLISWRGFLQGVVVLPWLHSKTLHQMGEKWRRWSRQAWRFLLLLALMGKKDCFWFPMNVGSRDFVSIEGLGTEMVKICNSRPLQCDHFPKSQFCRSNTPEDLRTGSISLGDGAFVSFRKQFKYH